MSKLDELKKLAEAAKETHPDVAMFSTATVLKLLEMIALLLEACAPDGTAYSFRTARRCYTKAREIERSLG